MHYVVHGYRSDRSEFGDGRRLPRITDKDGPREPIPSEARETAKTLLADVRSAIEREADAEKDEAKRIPLKGAKATLVCHRDDGSTSCLETYEL